MSPWKYISFSITSETSNFHLYNNYEKKDQEDQAYDVNKYDYSYTCSIFKNFESEKQFKTGYSNDEKNRKSNNHVVFFYKCRLFDILRKIRMRKKSEDLLP